MNPSPYKNLPIRELIDGQRVQTLSKLLFEKLSLLTKGRNVAFSLHLDQSVNKVSSTKAFSWEQFLLLQVHERRGRPVNCETSFEKKYRFLKYQNMEAPKCTKRRPTKCCRFNYLKAKRTKSWAEVVVDWSACSPSTPTIRVCKCHFKNLKRSLKCCFQMWLHNRAKLEWFVFKEIFYDDQSCTKLGIAHLPTYTYLYLPTYTMLK